MFKSFFPPALFIQTLFYLFQQSMIKDLNTTLTKGSIEITEYYSQKHITKEVKQERDKLLSQRSIRQNNKEQEVIRYATKQQKIASLIIRNIIRHVLRKNFKKMLQRLIIKKSAFHLLTSKRKRDLQNAFLLIKNHKIRSKHIVLQSFFQKHTPIKILCKMFSKKERENLTNAFECLKFLAIRMRRITVFSQLFLQNISQFIRRSIYSDVFNRLKIKIIHQHQREYLTNDILKVDQIRIKNLQAFTFNKVKQRILMGEYEERVKIKQGKQSQLLGIATSRKQSLAQIRQQLKTTKTSIDQQKLDKNKVIQERKKFNNNNKVANIEQIRKFDKQFKAEETITKQIEGVYNERERVMAVRSRLRQKSGGRQYACLQLLAALGKCQGDRVKRLLEYSSSIQQQLQEFKKSEQFLFKQNCQLQKLIQIYQKRQPYNYESQYYQLQYQNNVIRQMIRCFIKEQSYAQLQKRKIGKEDAA